jgi:hypothetical protein
VKEFRIKHHLSIMLKTHVMILNNSIIVFMSLSLILLALRLLISQKFNSENKFVFYKCTYNDE